MCVYPVVQNNMLKVVKTQKGSSDEEVGHVPVKLGLRDEAAAEGTTVRLVCRLGNDRLNG